MGVFFKKINFWVAVNLLFLLLFSYFFVSELRQESQIKHKVKDYYSNNMANTQEFDQKKVKNAIKEVKDEFTRIIALSNRTLKEVQGILQNEKIRGDYSKKESLIKDYLQKLTQINPHISSLGVYFKPYQFNPGKRLSGYLSYRSKNEKNLQTTSVGEKKDYTKDLWFLESHEKSTLNKWITSSEDEIEEFKFVQYTQALKNQDEKIIGHIFIRVNIFKILEFLNNTKLTENSYSQILSYDTAKVLIDVELKAFSGKNQEIKDKDYLKYLEKIKQGESNVDEGLLSFNKSIKQSVRVFFSPIKELGIVVKSVIFGSSFINFKVKSLNMKALESKLYTTKYYRLLFLMLLLTFAYLGAFNQLFQRIETKYLWVMSSAIAFFHLLAMNQIWVWSQRTSSKDLRVENHQVLMSASGIREFKKSYIEKRLIEAKRAPSFVPTGVFIKNIFSNANDEVILSGYLWQRYDLQKHKALSRKNTFPGASQIKLEKFFNRKDSKYEVIGWKFRATLKAEGEYTRYPFDNKAIKLEIWHNDFLSDVNLVPDINSYHYNSANFKPGINNSINTRDWAIKESFFYIFKPIQTIRYGVSQVESNARFPVFSYQINVTRKIAGPLVRNLASIIVVLLLLFFLLVIGMRWVQEKSNNGEAVRETGMEVDALSVCAGVIFITLIGHIDLRSTVPIGTVVYLEKLYFICYLSVLYVCSCLTILMHLKLKIFQYKRGLIVQLFYWPVIALMGFYISFFTLIL